MYSVVRPPRRKPEGFILALNRSGKSLTQIASEIGTSPSHLSMIGSGRINPTNLTLAKLAAALQCPPESLGLTVYPKREPDQTVPAAESEVAE